MGENNRADRRLLSAERVETIVIKVGSSSLCNADGRINREKILNLVQQIAMLKRRGYTVVLVSSGAIAAGMGAMALAEKPGEMSAKQALAAIGQAHLMQIYEEIFQIFDLRCSQILLNHNDFEDQTRLDNLRNTMKALLDYGAIPIVNENDALAVEEIRVGDNDTLAALLVPVVKAQLLILVSDIDGLFTANPHTHPEAELISYVEEVTDEIMGFAGEAGSSLGTGGMQTKLRAARMVNAAGSHLCIVNGEKPYSICRALENEGTWFDGKRQ